MNSNCEASKKKREEQRLSEVLVTSIGNSVRGRLTSSGEKEVWEGDAFIGLKNKGVP